MKTFKTMVMVRQPLDYVWLSVRDRLPDMLPLLVDIESIRTLERTEHNDGTVLLVNEWISSRTIPGPLKSRLGIDRVCWIDRNSWNRSLLRCEWRIEPNFMPEHIRCEGSTAFEPAMAGRATRVMFSGQLDFANTLFAGLPPLLDAPLRALGESIVTVLIPKNLRNMLSAVESQAFETTTSKLSLTVDRDGTLAADRLLPQDEERTP